MNIIIECTNFKPSAALNTFINEKAQGVLKLDAKITRMEFHLSVEREDHTKSFSCGLNVNIPGNDVAVHGVSDEAHDAVHKAIDSAKRSLKKIKTKRLASRRKAAGVTDGSADDVQEDLSDINDSVDESELADLVDSDENS